MLMQDAIKIMPAMWAVRATIEFTGPPGIGKTSVIEAFARTMSTKVPGNRFGYCEVVLSTMDSADVKGIPVLPRAGERDADVHWSKPTIFPNAYNTRVFENGELLPLGTEPPEFGLVLLDEYAQSSDLHQKATSSLLLDYRVGEYRLPPKWAVWLASNRKKDKAGVAKRLTLIQNRICEIGLIPTFEAWVKWADGKVHPDMVAFVKLHAGMCMGSEAPPAEGAFPTLRSVTLCDRALRALGKMKNTGKKLPADEDALYIMQGYLGEEGATKLLAHIRYGTELPDPASVAKAPETTPLPKRELQMIAAATLATHADKKSVGKFMQYLSRDGVMEEAALSFTTIIEQRDPMFVVDRHVSQWIQRHQRMRSTAKSV